MKRIDPKLKDLGGLKADISGLLLTISTLNVESALQEYCTCNT
jgi:hypothetical protein